MTTFLTLPTEIQRLILSFLVDIDVCSFFTARRTCRQFHDLVTDILDISILDHGPSIYSFLQTYFGSILDSQAGAPAQYLDQTDSFAPLRTLPWAADPQRREKFLRPDATWLRIPLISESGTLVRSLQVVICDVDDFDLRYCGLAGENIHFTLDDNDYTNEDELKPPGGVTIGGLYDVLLSTPGYDCPPVQRWQFRFQTRVQDLAAFHQLRLRLNDGLVAADEVEELFVQDKENALLYVVRDKIKSADFASDEGGSIWQTEHIEDYATLGETFHSS